MHDYENDRSATGFLESEEFEATAGQFFAHPTKSVRGWETAVRAQVRIVTEVEDALSGIAGDGDILFVGHGAVGTLLYCHYARLRDLRDGEHRLRGVIHGGATQLASLAQIKATAAMDGGPVVPHNEITDLPFVHVDAFTLGGVLKQIGKKQPNSAVLKPRICRACTPTKRTLRPEPGWVSTMGHTAGCIEFFCSSV